MMAVVGWQEQRGPRTWPGAASQAPRVLKGAGVGHPCPPAGVCSLDRRPWSEASGSRWCPTQLRPRGPEPLRTAAPSPQAERPSH